jgi:hypothetical protein
MADYERKLGGMVLVVLLITSLLAVFAGGGLVAAGVSANPVRALPAEVSPGDEFQVTVNFTAPADNFNSIGLDDMAPAGWNATVDRTWCTPAADIASDPIPEEAGCIWFGPYAAGVGFTAVYNVTVPADATSGTYNFTDGTLEYYIGGSNFTENITGDYQVTVVTVVSKYNLIVSSTAGGNVTTPGEGTFTYDEGTVVNLMATPDTGYRFANWTGNVSTVANITAAVTNITMNGDYSIMANFAPSGGGGAGGGCFIATAAYGTPMAAEVQILREFRDEYLLTNPVGQAFVDFYYKISPPIAEFITEHPSLKPIVRAGLMPAVAMSTVAVNTSPLERIAIVGVLALVSLALTIWVTRRRGTTGDSDSI